MYVRACVQECVSVCARMCVCQQYACQQAACVRVCLCVSTVCVCMCVCTGSTCVCVCEQQTFQILPPNRGEVSGRTRLPALRPEHSPVSAPWAPLASSSVCLLGRAGRRLFPAASCLPHGRPASTVEVLKPTCAQRTGPRLHSSSPESTITRVPTPAPVTSHTHKHFDMQLPRERDLLTRRPAFKAHLWSPDPGADGEEALLLS